MSGCLFYAVLRAFCRGVWYCPGVICPGLISGAVLRFARARALLVLLLSGAGLVRLISSALLLFCMPAGYLSGPGKNGRK